MPETRVQTLGQEDPLEKEMATHSSILAWRIPMDRGAWWTTVHRITKSWPQLKWLSTHTKDQRAVWLWARLDPESRRERQTSACISQLFLSHWLYFETNPSLFTVKMAAPGDTPTSLASQWKENPFCLHTAKPIYWHWVVVKESVAFITRPSKEYRQQMLKRTKLSNRFQGKVFEDKSAWSAYG